MINSKREQTAFDIWWSSQTRFVANKELTKIVWDEAERRTAERCAEIIENAKCADTVQQRIHVAHLRREFNLEKP